MFASKVGRKPKQAPQPLTEIEKRDRIMAVSCALATTKRLLAHAQQQAKGVVTERVALLKAERDAYVRRIEELTLDRKYWELP